MKHLHLVKKHLHRITRQVLDLLKQEIIAVLAVAVLCLVVVFFYSLHSSESGQITATVPNSSKSSSDNASLLTGWIADAVEADLAATLSSVAVLADEQINTNSNLGVALLDDDPTIYFGKTIKGYNRAGIETWQSEAGIRNYGNNLQVLRDNQVTISEVTNGNHTLWIKGRGTITINGNSLVFKTLGTIQKVISITNNTMTIKLKTGAQIYTISTLSSDTDIPAVSEDVAIPARVLMFPNQSTVTLGTRGTATFKPIVIAMDANGQQISGISNILSWSSSQSAVANVSTTGAVTATKTGSTIITASVKGTSLSASVSLTVRSAELSPLVDLTPKTGVTTAATPPVTVSPTAPSTSQTKTNSVIDFILSLFR